MYQIRRVRRVEIAVPPLHLVQAIDLLRRNRTALAPALSWEVVVLLRSIHHIGVVRQNRAMFLPLDEILRRRHAKYRLATIETSVGHVESSIYTDEAWIFCSVPLVGLGGEEDWLFVSSEIVSVIRPRESDAGDQALVLGAVEQEDFVVDYGRSWVEEVFGLPAVV